VKPARRCTLCRDLRGSPASMPSCRVGIIVYQMKEISRVAYVSKFTADEQPDAAWRRQSPVTMFHYQFLAGCVCSNDVEQPEMRCTNMPAAQICRMRSPDLDVNLGAWRLSQVCPHDILHVPAGMQPGLWNPLDANTLISAKHHDRKSILQFRSAHRFQPP